MADQDELHESGADKLPLTAELGDEGGSYGDGAQQAETLKGAAGNPRMDPKLVAAPGQVAEAMEPEREPDSKMTPADEPPGRPD